MTDQLDHLKTALADRYTRCDEQRGQGVGRTLTRGLGSSR